MIKKINIIDNKYKEIIKSHIFISLIKIELLDEFENSISEITSDISATNSGTINISTQQGLRKTTSFSIFDTTGNFIPDNDKAKLWIKKKIKIYTGVSKEFEDDVYEYWFNKGIFIVKSIQVNKGANGTIISIGAVDKFGLFTGETGFNELQGSYIIPKGTSLFSGIQNLLSEDIGNGSPIDPKPIIFPPSLINEVAPYDINKGPGSYLGDFLIEIANVLGCDIFYNDIGNLVFSLGTLDLKFDKYASSWDFDLDKTSFSNPNINWNITDLANSVTVVGDNINEKIFISTKDNNNPASSTRIGLIGKKAKYITSSVVYNQDRADDYATLMLNKYSIIQKTLSFSTVFMPHLDSYNIITLTDLDFNFFQERMVVSSISYNFGQGIMSINAATLADLPYYD